MSSSDVPPPPPPPASSYSGLTHSRWNSLVSEITIGEDEEGHHIYQQEQHERQHVQYFKQFNPNEECSSSFLEYSHSSDEAYASNHRRHHRDDSNFSSATSFRFREDITASSRVVRFASSSDQGGSLSSTAAAEGYEDSPLRQLRNDNAKEISRHHRHHHHQNPRRRGSGGSHPSSKAPSGGTASTSSRETLLSTPNRWVTQLAYSFRTPPAPKQFRKQPVEDSHSHRLTDSTRAPAKKEPKRNNLEGQKRNHTDRTTRLHTHSENTPLLPLKEEEEEEEAGLSTAAFARQEQQRRSMKLHRHPYDYISMAVAFLKDYEAGRPPTLAPDMTCITPWHLGLYRVKYSTTFSALLGSATLALFMSSALEGPSPADSDLRMHTISGLNLYALIIFATDLWIRYQFRNPRQALQKPKPAVPQTMTSLPAMVRTRTSQADLLTRPLFLFGLLLGFENLGWLLAKPDRTFVVLYSSIWKPVVLFYVSAKARHAMEALLRIATHVIRVLVIELVLILSFAAVACRLFTDFEHFEHLSAAWLSLFELATTVVNPSIWMPMYQKTHWSAIFFILFIVVIVFYMHSLVLSVVFQTYQQATLEIHERSVTDRENAILLAFASLKKQFQQDTRKLQSHRQQSGEDERSASPSQSVIALYLVRETLEKLRPHYNAYKINALVEIFDTTNDNDMDFSTFRAKIRQALNASIRTARVASPLSMSIELAAVVVALVNFLYVIMLTSSFSEKWFDESELEIGAVITIAGLVELVMRANPLNVPNFTPMTRFNPVFDGLAILAASISSFGIVMSLLDRAAAIEYILMGRAVDMVRVMRFFQFFREVVRRSSEVLPALAGPMILIMTMLHAFCYIGMAFWGGAIVVGELNEDEITPLYDLNNFNSYLEGLVTMFQVLVVNDWHAIAEVFLHASRCARPEIVYPFFITGNLVGVSILLNVVTAFFVEAFVYTKLSGGDGGTDGGASGAKDFSIKTSENTGVRRITSSHSLTKLGDDSSDAHDADSEGSDDSSEVFHFDILEREGYDKIIQTVSGLQDQDDFARNVCKHLELFESLSPGREKVGYLVCCQQSMNRYGNRRFESEAAGFIGKMALHSLVSEMHGELLVLLLSSKESSFGDRSLLRVLSHPTDPSKELEISSTVLRRHPALSLFVSRILSK